MTAEEKIECLEKKLKQALSWWRTAEKKFSQKCEETKANQKSIEQLKSENAALRERLEKAVEDVAERIKMAFYYEFDELIPSTMADKIDEIVKEVLKNSY